MKLKKYSQSNCPLCSIKLSDEMHDIIFYRKLTDETILEGINNRIGAFISSTDLEKHRQYHIGYEEDEQEKKDDVNEIEEIDKRIRSIRKKLRDMDAKNEIFSRGYSDLNRSLNELLKLKNEITKGITVNLNQRVSIREWVEKVFNENKKD